VKQATKASKDKQKAILKKAECTLGDYIWIAYAIKMAKFMKARTRYRAMLAVKGEKSLTGKKRQAVLERYLAVKY